MVIDSKYTKIFSSNSLTKQKYNELYDFAVYLREFKNQLSLEINNNLLFYLSISSFSFVTQMREKYKGVIPSSFDKQLYEQVFTCYQNKFKAIQKKLTFEKITFVGFEYYKRNTKKT